MYFIYFIFQKKNNLIKIERTKKKLILFEKEKEKYYLKLKVKFHVM